MRIPRAALVVGAAAGMILVAPLAAGHANTTANAVSLSGWNLALPVDSNGGTSGDARTISPATVYSPYLTRNSSGGLDFWAPADGARLGGGLHARTELRSAGNFTLGQGGAGLQETVAVTRLPDNSHQIIIAQMFETNGSPFAMLHYQSGKVFGYIHGQSGEYDLMSGIPLGAAFSGAITANGDTVKFAVTYDGKTVTATAKNIGSFIGHKMHFQAGDYQQDTTGQSASDGGRLTLSALSQTGIS